ncbi:hypothetical protein OC846_004649 [Tilletia horrida]|uniref:Uncharacterized protein n=1 Tax=Tilletia horrida TaxID=155126 RepID=A0AAN6GQ13_9BASI|nr:hypothetical protein OC846_004649 [Tilletia horrida]KAK0560352.1 hypothetical protein OC861_006314 [Tilletia horrida]
MSDLTTTVARLLAVALILFTIHLGCKGKGCTPSWPATILLLLILIALIHTGAQLRLFDFVDFLHAPINPDRKPSSSPSTPLVLIPLILFAIVHAWHNRDLHRFVKVGLTISMSVLLIAAFSVPCVQVGDGSCLDLTELKLAFSPYDSSS